MKAVFCILDADYVMEENKPVVRLWCKDSKGERLVLRDRRFVPYFFVEPRKNVDVEGLVKLIGGLEVEGYSPSGVERVKKKILGGEKELLKVTVQIPADVKKFRELVKDWKDVKREYEYGVPFYKRYIIDNRLTPMGWAEAEVEGDEINTIAPLVREDYPLLKTMAFDIELVEEKGGEKIIMISFADSSGFRRVISYGKRSKVRGTDIVKGEKELIEAFVETVQKKDPDVIVGYNSDMFDFTKLEERAKAHDIKLALGRERHLIFKRRGRVSAASLVGRVHVDLFNFIRNILSSSLSTEVLSLDRVARELIGKGKAPLDWKDIEKAWRKRDVRKIAAYCQKDSLLTLQLAEFILPQVYELCRVTGQTLFDTSRMFYSQLVEWLYIRRAHEFGEVSPSRPKYDEVQTRRKVSYLGGYVHTPQEGIHEKIALFDFASLYPTITITHNISPETLDCECCVGGKNDVPELNHHYCTKRAGFITKVLEDLVVKRIEIKERMKRIQKGTVKHRYFNNRQYALKILANASYGYYAYPGSRWYSKVCAESITSLGRMYIKSVISLAGNLKHQVIYGDTDSLFMRMNLKDVKPFLKNVNSILPGVMELDFKGFYPSGIFVLGKAGVAAKKRYALIDRNGSLVIRGFERVRRDWSAIAKDTQEKVLWAVLRDKNPEKAFRLVRRIVKSLNDGKVDRDDLIIYTQLTKPIHEYEQIGPHVAVAKKIIERGGQVRAGAIISYIVTKGSGSISDRAEPAESAGDYDPDYYINNQVLPAAMRILAGLGYQEDDFLKEGKVEEQISLAKYMRK
ncbi:MAG: ribonuclease H-like domain-containing protein [Candidatus Aenigmarchaeota archaeon]|nr:ribonuclease H-like domain-containing protein [Candidatus Aenigmarchaeota archaeon]